MIDVKCEANEVSLNLDKGLLLVTPHFGCFIAGIFKLLSLSSKKIYIFFDDPKNNPRNKIFLEAFNKINIDRAFPLLNNQRNIIKAINCLKNGDIVVVMPDVFNENHFYVPFLNKYFKTMAGSSYISHKASVDVLPFFCIPDCNRKNLKFVLGNFLSNTNHGLPSKIQHHIFTIKLFNEIESYIARTPNYWYYWADFYLYSLDIKLFNESNGNIHLENDFFILLSKLDFEFANSLVKKGFYNKSLNE